MGYYLEQIQLVFRVGLDLWIIAFYVQFLNPLTMLLPCVVFLRSVTIVGLYAYSGNQTGT